MEMKQIAELSNQITKEVLGESVILKEDLSNVVDLGKAILNANSLDKYVNALVDHIGRVVFVSRKYTGQLPKLQKTAWEYGAVLEKVRCNLMKASENESWQLEDGTSYDPNIFNRPEITAKFFNKRVTFEIDISITDMQAKSAFSNPTQLGSFISMIFMQVENSLTEKIESLTMRALNGMIGETLHDANGQDTPRAINVLKRYNTEKGTKLSVAQALTNLDFLKYTSALFKKYIKRMGCFSTLFNVEKTPKHTPKELLHVVILDDFASNCETYLESDTYHNTLVALPKYETIEYFQGCGNDFEFDSISKIDIKTPMSNVDISQGGIIACLFDDDAVVVSNLEKRVKAHYNEKAEFTNYFYKNEVGLIADLQENFVVFYLA